jgi:hypothetical protein
LQHCFDCTTQEGLINLLTLGTTVSLSHLLEPDSGLEFGLQKGATAERRCIHADFLEFQKVFCKRFCLMMDENKVHPQEALFDPLLLQLLVTVAKYKQKVQDTFDSRSTFKALENGILAYLKQHHLHLVSKFIQEMNKDIQQLSYVHFFQWSKPFTVIPLFDGDVEVVESGGHDVDKGVYDSSAISPC